MHDFSLTFQDFPWPLLFSMTIQAWNMAFLNSMTFHDFPGPEVTLWRNTSVQIKWRIIKSRCSSYWQKSHRYTIIDCKRILKNQPSTSVELPAAVEVDVSRERFSTLTLSAATRFADFWLSQSSSAAAAADIRLVRIPTLSLSQTPDIGPSPEMVAVLLRLRMDGRRSVKRFLRRVGLRWWVSCTVGLAVLVVMTCLLESLKSEAIVGDVNSNSCLRARLARVLGMWWLVLALSDLHSYQLIHTHTLMYLSFGLWLSDLLLGQGWANFLQRATLKILVLSMVWFLK